MHFLVCALNIEMNLRLLVRGQFQIRISSFSKRPSAILWWAIVVSFSVSSFSTLAIV